MVHRRSRRHIGDCPDACGFCCMSCAAVLFHETFLKILGEVGAHDSGDMVGSDFLHVVLHHGLALLCLMAGGVLSGI